MEDDRRVFARMSAKFPLRYLDPSSGKEGKGETTDICANGVGFITKDRLSNKAPLEMWLEIPDRHAPLYTRGDVVWAEEPSGANRQRIGVRLERAEFMGLGRAMWLKKRSAQAVL
jgi:hypothetical protein